MENKEYHIYTLTCPIDGVVRYVGCTRNIKARIRQHLRVPSGLPTKQVWIKSLLKLGLEPIVTVVDTLPDKRQAKLSEQKIYASFDSESLYCDSPVVRPYEPNSRAETYELHKSMNDEHPLVTIIRKPIFKLSAVARTLYPNDKNPLPRLKAKMDNKYGQRITEKDILLINEFIKKHVKSLLDSPVDPD